MADWTFEPKFDAEIEFAPPPTLLTKLDDGKVIMRVKHTNADETWTEEYDWTGTEFDSAKSFWDSHGVDTSFTKLSYDVAGTPTQERTVRFGGPMRLVRAGQDFFTVRVPFVRHY